MKYVAFLDVLGFKEKLKSMLQGEARRMIESFSTTVYHVFEKTDSRLVNGYIVSDSIILYTNGSEQNALVELVCLMDEICKMEFVENSILLRGAISKGEFDKVPAEELPRLRKELIVGQAYVDAYILESSIKMIGISLAEDVYQDLCDLGYGMNIIEEKEDNATKYVYRYLSVQFLMEKKNLREYIELATTSSWLPHYYNSLYFAMKGEKNEKKIDMIFDNILEVLTDDAYDWRDVDRFIENAFDKMVISRFRTRFLRFIRSRVLGNSDLNI